jgi:hypothetical protein
MLIGVLRMPPDVWTNDPLDEMQRHSRYNEAADEIEALEAENARLKTLLTRMYNKGYKAGHHDTVECQYVDILDEDMDTYHADIVNEILSE